MDVTLGSVPVWYLGLCLSQPRLPHNPQPPALFLSELATRPESLLTLGKEVGLNQGTRTSGLPSGQPARAYTPLSISAPRFQGTFWLPPKCPVSPPPELALACASGPLTV